MSLKENLATLTCLVNGQFDDARERLQRGNPIRFASFLREHHLHLCPFDAFIESVLFDLLPEEARESLQDARARQTAKQESVGAELMWVAALLEDAGEPFLLLKGPYLADRYYGAVQRRVFSDLDILIPRARLMPVEALLREHGFERRSTILLSTAVTTRVTHAFDYKKDQLALDLHWLLSAHPTFRLDYDAIWQQRQQYTLKAHQFAVLSDEYELVFNLLSLFRDLERGAARMKPFIDVYLILSALDARMDWDAFMARRRAEHVFGITSAVLDLLRAYLPCATQLGALTAAGVGPGDPPGAAMALLAARPGALSNKRWAMRAYDCSPAAAAMWWALSLPFRLAVYHPGKYARFKRNLPQWANRIAYGRTDVAQR